MSKNDFRLNERYGFVTENGQFELYLKPEATGIATPGCEEHVTVRMPATLSDDPDAEASIEEKKQLFVALQSVQESATPSQDITVEFNPYVRELSESPLELALTRCNIFFRAHRGRYIDNTDPLGQVQ